MYQQKFMPYNRMNEVYEEDQFQQQDSQPLIQEVDPNYQPNQKQIRQYALDVLGMSFPEDQRLLYLAKEGLKAPLPPNWQPYQSRQGQVYYKHKITQQKTYQHPTDVQYRKKYIQQKQRMARKNLKSMNLKSNPLSANPLSGLGQPINSLGSKPNINPLGLSNLSSQSHQNLSKQISKIDPKLEEELQRQLKDAEDKLKREYGSFQAQRQILHQKNMKKYKTEFQNSLKQLRGQRGSNISVDQKVKQQKQDLKIKLKQAYEDRLKQQLGEVDKVEQRKYNEFVQLYEQDKKIKLKKYENQKQNEYKQKLRRVEDQERSHYENKRQKEKQREETLSKIKQRFQKQDNKQIEEGTKETFQKQIQNIKLKNAQKIKQFQDKLQNEYIQMRKLLGHDQNQILQQMAEKKSRLRKVVQQKIESLKKKEYQKVKQQGNEQLERSLKQLEKELQNKYSKQMQTHKRINESYLQKKKSELQKQKLQQLEKQIQLIYSELKRSSTQYQKLKNKKISQIRQTYISQLLDKTQTKSQEINLKLSIKDKQQMIQNKQQLVESIRKQVQLQKIVLKDLNLCKNLTKTNNLDDEMKKLMNELGIKYKPEIFVKQEKKFNQLKQKYKSDKQFLGSMMSQLQKTSLIPFYQRSRGSEGISETSTTSYLIKLYNKDVRRMRKNQQMLNKYEVALRKAEINDQSGLKELQGQQFEYEETEIRSNMGRSGEGGLKEIDNIEEREGKIMEQKTYQNGYTVDSYKSVEDSLKEHSKFLSNIKAELNRKLYKVRSNNYYRV